MMVNWRRSNMGQRKIREVPRKLKFRDPGQKLAVRWRWDIWPQIEVTFYFFL